MAALPCSAPDCTYTTVDTVDNAANIQDKITVLRIHGVNFTLTPCMAALLLQQKTLQVRQSEPRWILPNSTQDQMCKPRTSSQQGGK